MSESKIRTVARCIAFVSVVAVAVTLGSSTSFAAGKKLESRVVSADELPPIHSGIYRIQVGDVVSVNFFKTASLNQTLTVGPDGDLYLPLVGRIRVAGRTVDQITDELTKEYGKEMVNPQVTVSVAEYSGLFVHISGEVQNPGIQPYRGNFTALKVVMDAGGFTEKASKRNVLLIRRDVDGKPVGTIVDMRQILKKGDFDRDVPLAPSDIIYVPPTRISNVSLAIRQYFTDNLPFSLFLGYDITTP
jgi:protein involved in polysaccharide export with SLBB domain